MDHANRKWLDGLKAGNLVALHYSFYPASVYPVVRMTRTQIIVPGEGGPGSLRRFSRFDGFQMRQWGPFDRTTVHPPTAEQVAAYHARQAAAKVAADAREAKRGEHWAAIRAFASGDAAAVPITDLERVVAALPK